MGIYPHSQPSFSARNRLIFSACFSHCDRVILPVFRPQSASFISTILPYSINSGGAAITKPMILPTMNGIPAHEMTQSLAERVRRNTSSSTAPPFPFPPQSQWGPGEIGTLVFGCIASVLGILTLWATLWLSCRRASRAAAIGVYSYMYRNVTDVLIKLQTDEGQELRDTRDGSSSPEQPSLNETHSIRDVNLRNDQGASC